MLVADPARRAVVERLARAGCVAAVEEASELLAAAPDAAALESLLIRREQGEPLAWITGGMQFDGMPLSVEPGVYVPRVQSEELVRRAAAVLPPRGRAVDLCTGSGAIAAGLRDRVPTASVIGIDCAPAAVACARRNGVPALVGELADPLRPEAEVDVVTAVPPYVPTGELRLLAADVQRYEPRVALDGGPDGLRLARRVVAAAEAVLRVGGWLFVELGGDQDEGLAPTLAAHGFGAPAPWWDDDDDLRGIAAQQVRRR